MRIHEINAGLAPLGAKLPQPHPIMTAKSVRFFGCAVIALSGLLPAQAGQAKLEKSSNGGHFGHTNIHEQRWHFLYDQRAYPLGHIPSGARLRAFQQIQKAKSIPAANQPLASGTPSNKPLVGGTPQWVNIGPSPIFNLQIAPAQPSSGRVTSIAVDPTNNAH